MLRHFPDKTKIVFFDLEYYVPEDSRERKTPGGMTFSPVLHGHKILGGTFQTYFPMLDKIEQARKIWEWRSGSEKGVLQEVLRLLKHEWNPIESRGQLGSLMLCGIGISHSDVPALLAKMTAHQLESPARIYDLLCGCRQIDLSTATYCQFSFNQSYFAYPKTKSHLYQKYLDGKTMESGKSVWQHYEAKDFAAIESRSVAEVNDSVAIYKAMFEHKKRNDRDIARLKKLDKQSKLAADGDVMTNPSFPPTAFGGG